MSTNRLSPGGRQGGKGGNSCDLPRTRHLVGVPPKHQAITPLIIRPSPTSLFPILTLIPSLILFTLHLLFLLHSSFSSPLSSLFTFSLHPHSIACSSPKVYNGSLLGYFSTRSPSLHFTSPHFTAFHSPFLILPLPTIRHLHPFQPLSPDTFSFHPPCHWYAISIPIPIPIAIAIVIPSRGRCIHPAMQWSGMPSDLIPPSILNHHVASVIVSVAPDVSSRGHLNIVMNEVCALRTLPDHMD